MDVPWSELKRKLETSHSILRFLRDNLNMSRREAQNHIAQVVEKMKEGKIPTDFTILRDKFIPAIREKNPARSQLFSLVLKEIEEEKEKLSGIIGRVTITKATPATPYRFSFWVKYSPEVHISPGTMVFVTMGDRNNRADSYGRKL